MKYCTDLESGCQDIWERLLFRIEHLVLEVEFFIQERSPSMNLPASPLSLYSLNVGHSSYSTPTTSACLRFPAGSYLLRISLYLRWLLKDLSDFSRLMTSQLVLTSRLTSLELSLIILLLLNFSKLWCLWMTLFGLCISGLLSRRLRLIKSSDLF